jgi:putative phage-type endonuclease
MEAVEVGVWRVLKCLGDEWFARTEAERLAALLVEFGIADVAVQQSDVVERIEQIKRDRCKLTELRTMPLVAQRSQEWFDLRKERLTASDISKVLVRNRTRETLVQNKAFPENAKFISTQATEWGKTFESMALCIYQARRANIIVHEFGLIPHPTLSCFGASPDGINELGVMIEIKCPYSREIIPGYIPSYYEAQMQGQMAVCDLKYCDYIECQIIRHDSADAYIAAAKHVKYSVDYGIVICGKEPIYSPTSMSPADTIKWCHERVGNDTHVQVIMWTLGHIEVQRVSFDEDRWSIWTPLIEEFWKDVLNARACAGTSTKNQTNAALEFIDDDD